MLPNIDSIKILHTNSFYIKSRLDIHPITFTNSFAYCDLQKPINKFLDDEYFILIVNKKNRLYKYNKTTKLGPIIFQIEDDKVVLTPCAVSKTGIQFLCCDNYIEELFDNGIDIHYMNEKMFFFYNTVDKIGKYIKSDQFSFSKTKKNNDLKNVSYYYLTKVADIALLITRTFAKVFVIHLQGENTKIQLFNLRDYIENLDFNFEEVYQKSQEHENEFESDFIFENNDTGPSFQILEKDFDINEYFHPEINTHHFLIMKALKIGNAINGFGLQLLDISFFFKKNEPKTNISSKFKILDIMVKNMRSKDKIILRLNQLKKNVFLVINKNMETEILFNCKYNEKLKKLENVMTKNIGKVWDAIWGNDFIICLTECLQLLAFNTRCETVFFVDKNNVVCNLMKVTLLKPLDLAKITQPIAHIMKNETEDCFVIYIDKTVIILKMDFEPKTRSNYLTSEDFLVSCLFSGDYQNHNKPILQRIMKKLKTIDPIRLNCFKLFHNYKKSRELLTYIHIETDNSLDFHLKKLEKNMCLLVLRHLNYYKDKFKLKCNFGPSNQLKFEKGQLELSKYYVQSLNKYPFLETKAKLKANMNNYYALGWLTKEYLFFSINLSFLLFGSLKWKKENKKFEALEEYCDFKWDFTQKMLDLIESMKILQIFSIIQQKSWNLSLFNSDSIEIEDFGLGLIFLLLFIKDLMLTKQNTIKSFNKLFLKDLIHYFRENKKFNDINNIFDYITKNHNGFLIKIEENSKNLEKQKGFIIKLQKVNLLNFLIFLLDYMNLHEFYLVFLKPYFKAQKIDTSIQLSILLTVLLITFEKPLKSEKKKKTQIFYEIFEEILLREKIFEKEVNGDISNEVSFILMALCAVLESNFNWEIDKVLEKIMDLYNFKLKLALGFIKKQYKNDQIYHIEFWEGSLLSDFILKFYKKNINLDNLTKKQDRDDGMIKYNGFSLYYKKTVKNLHILIGLTEKAVNLSFLDIFHDKTDPIKTKNAFVKKFNKLLYWNYYIFLKIMISENNDKFEKILFNFKLMKRFQKYEYNTKIIAFLENFAKDSKNIEILSKAHKNLIFFYLNQNNQMKGNLSEKIKFLAKFEFSDPTNVKENEEMGECYDRKCYLTFAESFLEFIKNNYGKKTEFLEMDERLKQKKNVLMQLHQKYSKAFDLSFNLFFEKGKWNVFK